GLLVVLDGWAVLLLAKIIITQDELGSFVIRVGGDQLDEKALLFCYVAVTSRLVREDEEFLSVGSPVRRADRFVQMLEELFGRRGTNGASQFRGGKLRIERSGLVKVLQGILGEKLFREIAPLQELLAGV